MQGVLTLGLPPEMQYAQNLINRFIDKRKERQLSQADVDNLLNEAIIRSLYKYGVLEQFARIRKEKKISQMKLDSIIGVTMGLVAKWETGERNPSLFNLYCWADALDCEICLVPKKE